MSMLAERKRKVKWSLNPRGKAWSQDSNKFGQKILEKMGWEQGKGLGRDGQGITEHIRTTYKNDNKGMGYKDSNDQWTEHEDNFASLLESLSGEAAKLDEVKLKSLEKKSETAKSRVHYHKFTRGKDLSRYSEKDLANIFGKKTLKESKRDKQEEKSDTNGDVHKYDSDLLVNAGSMRDYFKKKLPNFGKTNGYVVGRNGVLTKEESESESEVRPSFGFGYKSNGITSDENTLKNLSANGDGKNKSEETAKATFVSYLDVEETDSNKNNKKKRKGKECDEHSVLSPKKKPKKDDDTTPKKKSKTKVEENMGFSNPAFNPLPTPVKIQRHILNTIQESISENSDLEEDSPKTVKVQAEVYVNAPNEKCESETQKKKKKESQNIDQISEICNSEEKKSQKKKKLGNGFENDIIVEDIKNVPKKEKANYSIGTETEENPYEVKIKKKKKKDRQLAVDHPNFDDTIHESISTSQTEENPYEVKIKEKKKKRKKEQIALENPNFDATENSIDDSKIEANPYEVKVKEKKKKKVTDDSKDNSVDSSQIENPYEVKVKNKSKKNKLDLESSKNSVQVNEIKDKKKMKKEAFAIDNPHFNPNDSLEVDTTNNVLEVERKKKKKQKKAKNEGGIDNPALHLDTSQPESKEVVLDEIDESDIMLNVATTPIVTKSTPRNEGNAYSITKVTSVKRTKSVRFSDVTQERIIPNNDGLREIEVESETFSPQVTNGYSENHSNGIDTSPLSYDENRRKSGKKRKLGLDNAAFDKQKNTLEENLDSISKTIDTYQAEIENDINEKKLETFQMDDIMVGEVGNPHGKNEKLPDGSMLRFKYAHFKAQTPFYLQNKTGPKKSYKHLIKGDIVVKFKNSNLHEINGYASRT